MPWKNGQGSTTEIAVEPPGATLESFVWRASIAELRGSGPFSTFPGYERVIVQLDGAPMSLTHASGPPVALGQLVPHAFSGDDETTCAVDGVAHDFNLIVRRDVGRAKVTVHRLRDGEPLRLDGETANVSHVLEGALTGSDGLLLGSGDTQVDEAGALSAYRSVQRAIVLVASLA